MLNNYHMHLCEVRRFEDTGVFRTDIRQVFDFIRCCGDPGKLSELVMTDPAYRELDEDAYDAIADYVNSKELREIKKENQEGGKVNMSNVAMELIQMGRKEGMEQGMERGMEQGVKALIVMGKTFGHTKQETVGYIVEAMQMTEEDVEKYMEKYWH